MAVDFISGGTPGFGTDECDSLTPGVVDAENMLVTLVINKYPPNGPLLPAGYTLGAQKQGGSGSSAADSGQVYATAFYREADGTEDGATVLLSIPSGNCCVGKVLRFSKDAGYLWDLQFVSADESTGGADWSVTFPTTRLRPGDLVMVLNSINTNDYIYSSELLTAPGFTFINSEKVGDNGLAFGDDIAWIVTLHEVESGEGLAIPTFTMTASGSGANNPCGASILVRLREILPATGTADLPGLGASGIGSVQSYAKTSVGIGGRASLPAHMLTDRCDVIAVEQFVAGQVVHGDGEKVIARGVPCLVRQERASRLATLLGVQQPNLLTAWMGRVPDLRQDYVLRVNSRGRSFRYTVQKVDKHPSPHACEYQVAELQLELMRARG
jgi:hypothetical protein